MDVPDDTEYLLVSVGSDFKDIEQKEPIVDTNKENQLSIMRKVMQFMDSNLKTLSTQQDEEYSKYLQGHTQVTTLSTARIQLNNRLISNSIPIAMIG